MARCFCWYAQFFSVVLCERCVQPLSQPNTCAAGCALTHDAVMFVRGSMVGNWCTDSARTLVLDFEISERRQCLPCTAASHARLRGQAQHTETATGSFEVGALRKERKVLALHFLQMCCSRVPNVRAASSRYGGPKSSHAWELVQVFSYNRAFVRNGQLFALRSCSSSFGIVGWTGEDIRSCCFSASVQLLGVGLGSSIECTFLHKTAAARYQWEVNTHAPSGLLAASRTLAPPLRG